MFFQVFGSRVKVDAVSKVAELELAEKEKMKEKVEKILKHKCTVFINRLVCRCILKTDDLTCSMFYKDNYVYTFGCVSQTAHLQLPRAVVC